MSIAWATIALLVFLLPGFLFSYTIYAPETFSRDIARPSPLAQLAGVVFVSFLVHGTTYAAVGFIDTAAIDMKYVLSAFQVNGSDSATSVTVSELADVISQRRIFILGYIVLTSAAGSVIGYMYGSIIAKGHLTALTQHPWVYAVAGRKNELTYVYAMVKVSDQGHLILYRGYLESFGLSQDGQFSYLILFLPERVPITFHGGEGYTSVGEWKWVGFGDVDNDQSMNELKELVQRRSLPQKLEHAKSYLFYIGGRQIENVYLFRYPDFDLPDNDEFSEGSKPNEMAS